MVYIFSILNGTSCWHFTQYYIYKLNKQLTKNTAVVIMYLKKGLNTFNVSNFVHIPIFFTVNIYPQGFL